VRRIATPLEESVQETFAQPSDELDALFTSWQWAA
jgi:hypothetical protein